MLSADNLILIACGLATLFGQMTLCFFLRRLWVRLLPAGVFLSAAAGFGIFVLVTDGWTAVGCLLFALLFLVLLGLCGLGWGIWGVVRGISKFQKNTEKEESRKE
ncbi:MAG: hypothetical protein J6B54_00520 [Clostridia bacterium]|nr:hypothetical protein [Clostridia bacterium]